MSTMHEWTSSVTIALLAMAVVVCTYTNERSTEAGQVTPKWLRTGVRLAAVVLVIGAIPSVLVPGLVASLGIVNVAAGLLLLAGVTAVSKSRAVVKKLSKAPEKVEPAQAVLTQTLPVETSVAFDDPLTLEIQTSPTSVPVLSTDIGTGFTESKEIMLLVADGSDAVHDLIKGYLADTGYAPQFVRTGTEALSKFKSGRFRIVLMDIQLPELDGTAVIGMIREWEAINSQARTPVVAMIAKAATDYAEQGALGTGASSYVRKPLSRAKLLQALDVCRGQLMVNKAASVSSAATEITEEMLPKIPAFLVSRLREVDKLKREYLAQDAAEISLIADEIADAGSANGFPRLTQIGRTLASAASESDWDGLGDSIRDLEFYLEGLQSSVPVPA